jgi:hypothetical protein
MTDDSMLAAHLLGLEVSLHRHEVRRSRDQLERLLAPDFREFGRSGRIYDRATNIRALLAEAPRDNPPPLVSDVACALLAADCALLTYRTTRRDDGGDISSLRSSIWKSESGTWRMIFHQGTPA